MVNVWSEVSCVFFFKQKTAYEMRISDWSSDVCSSDLVPLPVEDDGLARSAPSAAGVDAAAISAFLDDVETAGLELHDLMVWRDGAVVTEAWRWPYSPDRLRMTHSMTKSFTACALEIGRAHV